MPLSVHSVAPPAPTAGVVPSSSLSAASGCGVPAGPSKRQIRCCQLHAPPPHDRLDVGPDRVAGGEQPDRGMALAGDERRRVRAGRHAVERRRAADAGLGRGGQPQAVGVGGDDRLVEPRHRHAVDDGAGRGRDLEQLGVTGRRDRVEPQRAGAIGHLEVCVRDAHERHQDRSVGDPARAGPRDPHARLVAGRRGLDRDDRLGGDRRAVAVGVQRPARAQRRGLDEQPGASLPPSGQPETSSSPPWAGASSCPRSSAAAAGRTRPCRASRATR